MWQPYTSHSSHQLMHNHPHRVHKQLHPQQSTNNWARGNNLSCRYLLYIASHDSLPSIPHNSYSAHRKYNYQHYINNFIGQYLLHKTHQHSQTYPCSQHNQLKDEYLYPIAWGHRHHSTSRGQHVYLWLVKF